KTGSDKVTVRDSDDMEIVDQTFQVTVEDLRRAPKITSDPETYVKEEVNYTYNIKADDPDGNNVSFDYASGPGWLSLVSTNPKKSTRLNSSHVSISYAVFCLKKKKKKENDYT